MFHKRSPNEHLSQKRLSQLKQLSTCTSLTDSQQVALETASQSLPLSAATIADTRQQNTDDVASYNYNRTSAGGSVGRDPNIAALLQSI